MSKIIAVDFDGTIVSHMYPEIGVDNPNAIRVLKKLIEQVKASAGAATSARMVGTGLEAGKSMTFDLRGNRDGSNAEMTVTQDGQGTAVLRNVQPRRASE